MKRMRWQWIAALVMAIVLVLLLALSLPALAQVGAAPADQPVHAPAGLGL